MLLAVVLLGFQTGCSGELGAGGSSSPAPVHPPVFREIGREAGIDHVHQSPLLDPKLGNIMPWMSSVGAAVAAGDFDGDGRIDLYLTTSRKGRPNRLYRNNGDGTFTDVAAAAGLAEVNDEGGVSMDCAWGDFDNDGRLDLFLVRWGRDALFHNDGDGVFSEVTDARMRQADGTPGTGWRNGNAVVWLDYDRDGRLDLYVGNYFGDHDLWHLETTRIMHDDFERARNGGRNQLFRQLPDGTFEEVAAALNVDDSGWTLAVGAADVTNDGWPDIYSANDFGPDQLFVNDRQGSFVNASETALGFDTKKGMNVDFGDFDNDGWLDVYVTNITTAEYLQEGNMLWRNHGVDEQGMPRFTDIALESGTYDGGWGWGAKFIDFDHDADLDLVALNGFISAGEGSYWHDLASWTVLGQNPAEALNWPAIGNRSFSGGERTRAWRNDGFSSFTERAEELGFRSSYDGRGLASLDYDDDGDLDLYVANQNQPGQLYRNEGENRGHWLRVRLAADPRTGTNRDALGTRVTAVTRGGQQIRERDGGNGYAGQSEPRLHFGLGAADRLELLEIRWPDGGYQYLEDVPANREVLVRQDPTAYVERILPATRPTSPRPAQRTPAVAQAAALETVAAEGQLDRLEERLRRAGAGDEAAAGYFTLASEYRRLCAENGLQDRAIGFFEGRTAAAAPLAAARVQLAAAYVDKIPTCGGVAAVICKGTLAKRALGQLDRVIAEDPTSWIGHYTRGINHLHWPRALRHSGDAAADLERCVELQPKLAGDEAVEAARLRVHVALGDAYAKAGDTRRARQSWQRGLRRFPGAPELVERLAFGDPASLLAFVESERSLERPIDTDLSFYDRLR